MEGRAFTNIGRLYYTHVCTLALLLAPDFILCDDESDLVAATVAGRPAEDGERRAGAEEEEEARDERKPEVTENKSSKARNNDSFI